MRRTAQRHTVAAHVGSAERVIEHARSVLFPLAHPGHCQAAGHRVDHVVQVIIHQAARHFEAVDKLDVRIIRLKTFFKLVILHAALIFFPVAKAPNAEVVLGGLVARLDVEQERDARLSDQRRALNLEEGTQSRL